MAEVEQKAEIIKEETKIEEKTESGKEQIIIKDVNITNLEKEFECPVCKNLLCNPITLPCQHTFCEWCIIEAVKNKSKQCPLCRKVIFIPQNKNVLLETFVKTIIGDENYSERQKEVGDMKMKLDLETKVRLELRDELYDATIAEVEQKHNANDVDVFVHALPTFNGANGTVAIDQYTYTKVIKDYGVYISKTVFLVWLIGIVCLIFFVKMDIFDAERVYGSIVYAIAIAATIVYFAYLKN